MDEILWSLGDPNPMNLIMSMLSFFASFLAVCLIIDAIKGVVKRELTSIRSDIIAGATLVVLYLLGSLAGVWLVLSFLWFAYVFIGNLF